MTALVDITGARFSRLLVLRREGSKGRAATWRCLCDCGAETVAIGSNLRNGHTRSCGCLRLEETADRSRALMTRHGMAGTRVWRIWEDMKSRCLRPSQMHYAIYGGRGIRVCERWMTFENFFADMGHPPTEKHSLDRIDNDGHYEPGNCRWATNKEQSNNKRNSRFVEYRGERLTVSQFAERVGISVELATWRLIRHGWTPERAASPPRAWTRK